VTAPRDTGKAAQCVGKIGFESRAKAAAVCTKRSNDARKGRVPYRCCACHLWHVGHSVGKPLRLVGKAKHKLEVDK
jgi:hypothetical protein